MSFFDTLFYRIKHGRAPEPRPEPVATFEPHKGRGEALPEGDGLPTPEHPELIVNPGKSASSFLAGRREFTDQFSHLARGKRNWQIAAFAALGLLCVVTFAYIHLASTSRITPYVVEVDALGQARAFGPAERMQTIEDRLTIAQLSIFIRNIRSVYQDPMAQRDMIVRAYAFVDASAQEWLNGYFSDVENDPRLLARKLSRRIEVKSVIAIPESESWKVTWIEVETPHGTDTQKRTAWEGYLTLKQVPPTSAATIEYNPLGLYITAINWTQVTRG